MFRKMRRAAQQLTQAQCEEILRAGTNGVLAVAGDEGYPYAVPLSYVYDDGKIYFHGARTGHKLDAIRRDSRVSFCVVEQDNVVPEEYTTYFGSVIVFGRAQEITGGLEFDMALAALGRRYHPTGEKMELAKMIATEGHNAAIIRLDVEHMTGKRARELMKH